MESKVAVRLRLSKPGDLSGIRAEVWTWKSEHFGKVGLVSDVCLGEVVTLSQNSAVDGIQPEDLAERLEAVAADLRRMAEEQRAQPSFTRRAATAEA